MSRSAVIVVIEDEQPIRRVLRTGLQAHGYEVRIAEDGRSGLDLATAGDVDLVVLDLGLPDMDGIDVVKALREQTWLPVIVLTARNAESAKVTALDIGADDYLTKPFSLDELLARIRVALRRNATPDDAKRLRLGDLTVDFKRRRVSRGAEELHLTPIEFRLLCTLIKHGGKVLTHEHLLAEVWGRGHEKHTQYLRIYIGGLRKKLEKNPARPKVLLTEAGVGYKLAGDMLQTD
ncbi:MAG: response regulator [Betaproteobacteria bacterium]|nr:response regulator [Betaproteobacteria bacterium]